jgi:hypothetical protein
MDERNRLLVSRELAPDHTIQLSVAQRANYVVVIDLSKEGETVALAEHDGCNAVEKIGSVKWTIRETLHVLEQNPHGMSSAHP